MINNAQDTTQSELVAKSHIITVSLCNFIFLGLMDAQTQSESLPVFNSTNIV